MNVALFVDQARMHCSNEIDRMTDRKLALRFASLIDTLTTTAIKREVAIETAQEALRTLTTLGIRIGLDEDDLLVSLHSPSTPSVPPLVQSGYLSAKYALDCVVAVHVANWDRAVGSFKALLEWRNITFQDVLSSFILRD
ncbi:hypothetical protein PHOBOS_110 [Erwinia phage vB_EamM_Phobos]|uniref:hypothetical protein n=1 Tax=Erwinia phage vB_EamM_Phobos TaxID=1883377 RepID=UPI00081CB0AF|nr:hypothetical protein BIZ79_gp110 [Erwinia phage vB_EamM_Phobos]ANZ50300.1 hypothetical protein PHOBOS_110 [Erwinia phage vB_EamM_Phobos]